METVFVVAGAPSAAFADSLLHHLLRSLNREVCRD